MSKYQLAGEDEHTYKIRHADGSEFHIAKNGIGPEFHKRIKKLEPIKMAEGGEVPDPRGDAVKADDTLPDSYELPEKYTHMQAKEPVKSLAETLGLGSFKSDPYGLDQTAPAPIDQAAVAAPSPAPIAGPAPAGVPTSAPMPVQQPVAAPVANQPINPLDPAVMMAAQDKALGQQQAAINTANKVQQQEFQQQAAMQQKFAQDVAEVDSKLQAQVAPIRAQNQELSKALLNGKADGNRLWNNMSTGNKVLASISILLGGIGQGLSGKGPNVALDVIDKAIDKDIEAQRMELGKKQTLFSENLRMIGDANAAAAITKGQLLTNVQAMLQSSSARMQSAQANQQAQMASSEIELKKQQIHLDAAFRKVMLEQGTNGGGPETEKVINYMRWKDPKMAEDMEKRYVPGIGMSSIPVPNEVRGTLVAKQQLGDMAKDFYNWAKKNSGSLDPATIAEGKTKAAELQSLYRNAINGGVFKKGEQEFIDTIIDSDPTKFFNNIRVLPKLNEIIKSNESQLNILKKGYGLPAQAAQQEQFKTVNGIKYKRGPNGEAIRVQ